MCATRRFLTSGCFTWSMFRSDYAGVSGCRLCGTFLDPPMGRCEIAAPRRSRFAPRMRSCTPWRLEARGLGYHNGTARLTEATPWPTDMFDAAAVPGRGAAHDVCVAPSNAGAARGDAAQAAFDQNASHYRREIQDLRVQGVFYFRWFGQLMVVHTQLSHERCGTQS